MLLGYNISPTTGHCLNYLSKIHRNMKNCGVIIIIIITIIISFSFFFLLEGLSITHQAL